MEVKLRLQEKLFKEKKERGAGMGKVEYEKVDEIKI